MAATFTWCEDNGSATGSPAHGTTQFTSGATDSNWKNADDCTANSGTAYSAAPINASANSYTKYQYGKFSGTFNQVSAGLWAHITTAFGSSLTLKGIVTTTYATPATSTNASLTVDMTSAIAIGSGQTVLFVATGPQTASPGSSCSTNPCYTQYLASQLQVGSSPAAGDTATVTLELQYQEN